MEVEFAVAWARHARWHHSLVSDADGVLSRASGLNLSRKRARHSIEQWHAHRELHQQMLEEVEQELPNASLVIAHHKAGRDGQTASLAILAQEKKRRGLISNGKPTQ
jgi:hypothetical protein